jgi:hypothetical protein
VSGDERHEVRISRRGYRRLMSELARRGRGALLLARAEARGRDARRVADILYFDDLDPEALNGAISIRGEAFGTLFEHCEERGLRVIADIHTHPGCGVAQSPIDAANPMVDRRGHVGIIAPHFAQRDTHPRHVGFHVYEGDRTWASAFGKDAAELLHRTWW